MTKIIILKNITYYYNTYARSDFWTIIELIDLIVCLFIRSFAKQTLERRIDLWVKYVQDEKLLQSSKMMKME